MLDLKGVAYRRSKKASEQLIVSSPGVGADRQPTEQEENVVSRLTSSESSGALDERANSRAWFLYVLCRLDRVFMTPFEFRASIVVK